MQNLIFDRDELASARAIVVMVPGAFSRVSMFDATQAWRAEGYGLVYYRFPGLDGRPIAPPLRIATAAQEIISLASEFPQKPLRLLGFSTGGAVAMTAAAQLDGDLRVALMACAVARGGGIETFRRVTQDMASAALRARTTERRRVWMEYYRILLFGRAVLKDSAVAARADQIIYDRREKIVFPDEGRPHAHTSDLRRWSIPKTLRFEHGQARLFWGMEDPVFSQYQQSQLAGTIGAHLTGYPGQGHLLFATYPEVFDDVFTHFEGKPVTEGGGISLL